MATCELQHAVVDGTIDFAVVTAPGSPQTLDVIPLGGRGPPPGGPPRPPAGRARPSVDLPELADEEFVFPTKSFNVTAQFMDACRRVGFEPKVAYQTGSFESVKDFVRARPGRLHPARAWLATWAATMG